MLISRYGRALSLLLLCSFSSASTALSEPELAQLRKTNRIMQSGRGRAVMNPFVAQLAVYEKYGVQPPTAVVNAASAVSSGVVKNAPSGNDAEWLCNITVGKQVMQIEFDTGSSDFWVFSKALPAAEQGQHTLYQLEGKKSAGKTWDASYQDGSGAKGTVYVDKVVAGPFTVTSMGVQAATSLSSSFTSGYLDGVLGLAFASLNTCKPSKCYTFQSHIAPSLAQNLFTATLRHLAPGEYDFGFIDPSKYTGKLTHVNAYTAAGYWQFTTQGYAVGSGPKIGSQPIHITVDTGTTYTYLNEGIIHAYYVHVSGATFDSSIGSWIFPCTASLPNFSLFFANTRRTMAGLYVNAGAISDTMCLGTLQPNTGLPFSILGDSFLKSQFVIFNKQTSPPRLGWAQQAPA